MPTPHPSVLRHALIEQAIRACSSERGLAWAYGDEAKRDASCLRNHAVRRCETLLAYAASQDVISERTARSLAGAVYDALAVERRAVEGTSHAADPEGHWQRVEALEKALKNVWRLYLFGYFIRRKT